MIAVFHCRHRGTVRGTVASQFVGDQPTGLTALAFEQTAEKAFSRFLISSASHQNINHVTVLVNGPPEIVAFAVYRNKHFVDMPGIAQLSVSLFEFAGIVRSKLVTPLANGFIGDGDAALGEQLFHFTEAEAEPMIKPHGMADDCGWKVVTGGDGWFDLHRPSLPNSAQLDNALHTLPRTEERDPHHSIESPAVCLVVAVTRF